MDKTRIWTPEMDKKPDPLKQELLNKFNEEEKMIDGRAGKAFKESLKYAKSRRFGKS